MISDGSGVALVRREMTSAASELLLPPPVPGAPAAPSEVEVEVDDDPWGSDEGEVVDEDMPPAPDVAND